MAAVSNRKSGIGSWGRVIFFGIILAQACGAVSYEQALALYRKGDQEAINAYKTLLTGNNADIRVYLDLAALYKDQGRYSDAIAILEKVKDCFHDVQLLLGELYYLNGEDKRALSCFTSLLKEKEYQWLASLYLGLIHEARHKESLALQYYRRSFDLKNNSLSAYRLGKLLYHRREYDKAVKYFRQSIEIDSSIRPAYYFLARSFYEARNYEQAYTYFAKALNFFPEQKTIKEELDKVKEKLGRQYFVSRQEQVSRVREEKKLAAYQSQPPEIPRAKVGIIEEASQFSWKCGSDFEVRGQDKRIKAFADTFYTAVYRSKDRVAVYNQDKKKLIAILTAPLFIEGTTHPFYLLDVTTGKGDFWQKNIDTVYKGDLEIITGSQGLAVINCLDLETYLYGVIAAEILSSSPLEALKAQAVAARTIAFRNFGRHKRDGYDFCNSTHCQVYRGVTVETAATTRAVDETKGEIMTHNGEPIEAFYHANCGGCLRNDIYGQQPFLFSNKRDQRKEIFDHSPWGLEQWVKQVPPAYCHPSRRNNYRWQRIYDAEDFELVFGYPLNELKTIYPRERGDCGHIKKLQVDTGSRKLTVEKDVPVRDYLGSLKSSAFLLEIRGSEKSFKQNSPSLLIIWGAGFGHGGGMCQEGAISQAKEGFTYQDILKHYYKDIEIKRAY